MHSHFLKIFLRETLHFAGCWLFLKKWNNEGVVINITPPYSFNSPHTSISPRKCKKNFCPHKILANFQIKSPDYNGGQKPWRTEKYLPFCLFAWKIFSFLLVLFWEGTPWYVYVRTRTYTYQGVKKVSF